MKMGLHLATLILVNALGVASSAQATSNAGPDWWGPSSPGEGFHIRVPVTVTNLDPFPVTAGTVIAQLDLTSLLSAAGWTVRESGAARFLSSFELDTLSARVIRVTDFFPSGGGHGTALAADDRFTPTDPRRFEVPSEMFPGFLMGPQPPTFDGKLNPIISVIWRVTGTLMPESSAYFFVYLDSTLNGEKTAPVYEDTLASAALQGLFWQGPGATLYGAANPPVGQTTTVEIRALQANTRVELFSLDASGNTQRIPTPPGYPNNPVTLGQFETAQMFVTSGAGVSFQVVANNPVLAQVGEAMFVPSIDQGMAGTDFFFSLREPPLWEQDTAYFTSTGTGPTTVRVTHLESGEPFLFHLNDEINPFNYTVGARSGPYTEPESTASRGGCFPATNEPSPRLLRQGEYRAQVLEGGDPVLLKIANTRRITQAPTTLGAPVGTHFASDMGFHDQGWSYARAPICIGTGRLFKWYAAGVDDASGFRVTSPDQSTQIDPPGTDPLNPPRPRAIEPAINGISGPFPAPLLDRPLMFDATERSWLFTGLNPPIVSFNTFNGFIPYPGGRPVYEVTPVPNVAGPFGGANVARDFTGFGPIAVFAPFNDTLLEASLDYIATGPIEREERMAANAVILFDDFSSFDRLHTFRIHSNRPIIVVGTADDPTFLGGQPPLLDYAVGPAEFRGYLIELSSLDGKTRITGTTGTGTPITYLLKAVNRGRGVGGSNLDDTIDLALGTIPAGWEASLDRETTSKLPAGASETFALTVTPGPDLPAGSLAVVEVKGQSRGNPNMIASVQVVTSLQRSFAVGMWFETVKGPQVWTNHTAPGEPTTYRLLIKNLGTVQDSYAVEASPAEVGWSQTLTRNGNEVDIVTLGADQTAVLNLQVTPPLTGATPLYTRVTATSLASPATGAQVTAITAIRAPSDVHLIAPTRIKFVKPGENATFPLTLINHGEGTAQLRLDAQSDGRSGWDPPFVQILDPVTGDPVNIHDFSLRPGRSVDLEVRTLADKNASSGDATSVRFEAQILGTNRQLEEFFFGSVVAVHDLEITAGGLPLQIRPGAVSASITLQFANAGNLGEALNLSSLKTPPEWGLTIPSPLLLPRNETADVLVQVSLPPDAPRGTYELQIRAIADDGNQTTFTIPVVVGLVARSAVTHVEAVKAMPGVPVTVAFPIQNQGNVPLRATLAAAANETWEVEPLDGVTLPPGGVSVIRARFIVPLDEPDGTSVHSVAIRFQPTEPGATSSESPGSVTLEVGRPNLALRGFRAFAGPAGDLIIGIVENKGSRTAHGVALELFAGDAVVDQATFDHVPANYSFNVTLRRPFDQPGPLRVAFTSASGALDASRSDNAMDVHEVNSPTRSAGPGDVLIMTLLAVGFAGVRMRRSVA